MRFLSAFLFASAHLAAQPRPSAAEQARTLELARDTALHYAKTLPDFICTESIQRSSMFGRLVQSADKLTVQLTYFGEKEKYTLVAIDGKPTTQPFESLDGLLTGGEFGSMLFRVFDPASASDFQWKSWATIAKRPAALYSYRVDRANSHYTLGYRTDTGELRTATVGQSGVVALDRATSMVLRLTVEAVDIPKDFAILSASTTTEYGFIEVGGNQHLLPVRAESEMLRSPTTVRNVVSFVGYRKFSADSTIDFGSGAIKKQ
jgi:hypothetical protein